MAVEDDAAIEDLRRAMYRPGAGREAVARYEAARARSAPRTAPPIAGTGSVAVDGSDELDGAAPARARRAVRRWLPAAAAVVAALAVGVALAVVRTPAPVPTSAADLPRHAPTPDVADLVVAGTFRTAQGASIRKEVHGGVVRVTGVGPAVVPLRAAEPSARGGVVTVLVTVDRGGAEVGWAVLRMRADGRTDRPVLAGATTSRLAVPSTASTVYGAGDRPNVVAVRVGAGVRWSAVVVLADRTAPG